MKLRTAAFATALWVATPLAWAHGSVKGLGDFGSGVVHPLLAPAHLIALIAFGLLLGQRGLKAAQPALACFAVAAVAGLAYAALVRSPDTDVALLAGAALAGVLVATAALTAGPLAGGAAAKPVFALLGVGLGGALGLGSRPDVAVGSALALAQAGTALGLCLWLLNVVALSQALLAAPQGRPPRPWLDVLVRVMGSWVTASALLVLALWVRGVVSR